MRKKQGSQKPGKRIPSFLFFLIENLLILRSWNDCPFPRFLSRTAPHSDVWSADAANIFDQWRTTARVTFPRIRRPAARTARIVHTKSGGEIVGQLYNFVDKGDRAVAFAPEMTPTLARMVRARTQLQKTHQVVRHPAIVPLRTPAKGRLREHFQFNATLSARPMRRRCGIDCAAD